MSSFNRFADALLPTVAQVSLLTSAITVLGGLWKLTRFLGLCRLFKRWCIAANTRMGIITPLGVLTDRERRSIEVRSSASERAGPPLIF